MALEKSPPLIEHIEHHLGDLEDSIVDSWGAGTKGSKFQILELKDQPVPHAITYMTLGISDHLLEQETGPIRQELIFSCWEDFAHLKPQTLVSAFGMEILDQQLAVHNHEVVGPGGPILGGLQVDSIYCISPRYFPEPFEVCEKLDPPVVFVWLVPLYQEEAQFVDSHGWEQFEQVLYEQDPDILDLERSITDLPVADSLKAQER